MPRIAPITDANPTVAEMEARVARFRALEPTDDYIDARIPGCERTTWRVLGEPPHAPLPPGVSRGFRNIASEPALLLGMANGRDPGHINWPEPVRAAARAAGVQLPG